VLSHLRKCALWVHALIPRPFGRRNSRPSRRILPHWTSGGIPAGDHLLGRQPLSLSAPSSRAREVLPAGVSGRLDAQWRLRSEDHWNYVGWAMENFRELPRFSRMSVEQIFEAMFPGLLLLILFVVIDCAKPSHGFEQPRTVYGSFRKQTLRVQSVDRASNTT
jgi:hypothetical protein